jgi:hypothetical protein
VFEADHAGEAAVYEHRCVQHGRHALLFQIALGERGGHRMAACIGGFDDAAASQRVEVGSEALRVEHVTRRMPMIGLQLLPVEQVDTEEPLRADVQIPDAGPIHIKCIGSGFGQCGQCAVATTRQPAVGTQAHHGGQLPLLPLQA